MLEERLAEWVEKVLDAYNSKGTAVDTLQMMIDVDKIIAEEFDHECCLDDNR